MIQKINPEHLRRKAILYVRQSSPAQVLHNQESRRLQYAMKDRLLALGWAAVDIIDDDLGKSAGGRIDRPGFQRLVAEVSLAEVGVVAARELSRFARNSRDWQQLIEVCRIVNTLLLDEEAIYDARESNDRLLLGLKGSLSEYELDLLRQRSQKARQQKALRCELGMNAPVGYINAGEGRREKDPDQRVQQAVLLVFEKFLELGTVRQVLMWLTDQQLQMPYMRCEHGNWGIRWRAPTYHALLRMLKHPIYAGAYTWGRSRTETTLIDGKLRRVHHCQQQNQWMVFQRDHHDAYVTWENYERIQQMIRKNAQSCTAVHEGAPKRGSALLAGVLRCRRCGRKLAVRYTGGSNNVLRYVCHRGYAACAEPRCIGFSGEDVDDAVTNEVLRVIQPAAVEAALLAGTQVVARHDQKLKALELERQASQYEADRARRQYDAVEPENRLVAAELERRWNTAIQRVQDLERRCDEHRRQHRADQPPDTKALLTLAHDVQSVWNDPATDVRIKKRIVRALIEEVIADVDPEAAEIRLILHWKGGVHTERNVSRRRSGNCRHHVPQDTVNAVKVLTRICPDDAIAAWLTRNGLLTGQGNCWTRQHVTGLRHRHGIDVHEVYRQESEGWMNLTEAAAYLGVDRRTLREAMEQGQIHAEHPLPIGPWVVKRTALDEDGGRGLKERIARHRQRLSGDDPENLTPCLFSKSSREVL